MLVLEKGGVGMFCSHIVGLCLQEVFAECWGSVTCAGLRHLGLLPRGSCCWVCSLCLALECGAVLWQMNHKSTLWPCFIFCDRQQEELFIGRVRGTHSSCSFSVVQNMLFYFATFSCREEKVIGSAVFVTVKAITKVNRDAWKENSRCFQLF